jgi:DNA repair exonuclease SbcCD nuclease subunit
VRFLLIGDPHVQVSNLEESKLLFNSAFETAKKEKVDGIIILGDCFHNHDVIRSQVMNFWLDILKNTQGVPVTIVTGNHDMPGSKELEGRVSALDALSLVEGVTIIKAAVVIKDIGYVPYMHGSEGFVEAVNKLYSQGAKTIFCHQTFDSAQFENGFYAPHGVDPQLMPLGSTIISGHIHQQQEIKTDKALIWYPGTPRWLTASDANSTKGYWVYDTSSSTKTFFDVSSIIPPMVRLTLSEGDEIPAIRENNRDRVYVNLIGSGLWIKGVKKDLPEEVRVSSTITDHGKKKRNFDKKKVDIHAFIVDNYTPSLVTKEELSSFLKVFAS